MLSRLRLYRDGFWIRNGIYWTFLQIACNYTSLLPLYAYAGVHSYVFTSRCSVAAFRLPMVGVLFLWFPELSPYLRYIHSRLTHCLQIANSATLTY
jgi:hypothetical protein